LGAADRQTGRGPSRFSRLSAAIDIDPAKVGRDLGRPSSGLPKRLGAGKCPGRRGPRRSRRQSQTVVNPLHQLVVIKKVLPQIE